ncbi:MAG: ArsR/SmtB family transcription factor [Candidatus Saccharimonadales bacterium]
MVEDALSLDSIFHSLADGTRRDILQRVVKRELTVSEIAAPYDMSLAAISKHLKILERARLVVKRRRGKYYFVRTSPRALKTAEDYLKHYETLWNERFDALEKYLKESQHGGN